MLTNSAPEFTKHHCHVAAEAFAAALLAQAGYDVSVQYGANQPLYDLVALKTKPQERFLQVSVKGSRDGGWITLASYARKAGKEKGQYLRAADSWLAKHGAELVFVFVQFEEVQLGIMPRVYVARAREVAAHLKTTRKGIGNTILYEHYEPQKGPAKGCTDKIPAHWLFSQQRIDSV